MELILLIFCLWLAWRELPEEEQADKSPRWEDLDN